MNEDQKETVDLDPPKPPRDRDIDDRQRKVISDRLLTLFAMVAFSAIIIAVQLLSANKVDADEFWRSFYTLIGVWGAGGSIAGIRSWLSRRAK